MLFATSLGEHAVMLLLAVSALLWLIGKAITMIDDDGEVRKKANEGLADWIPRWFK